MLKCDAVFQGGGVKGIGFAGAVAVIERAGYEFENLAGTSAGAIVASLLAAGYTSAEITHELHSLDYTRFREETWLDKLGLIGKALNMSLRLGIYKTDYFESWLGGLLERKGKRVFADLLTEHAEPRYKYKFQAIASDISHRRMLVLPGDLIEYGINPDGFSIARAVRMSISIPFYFMPYRLKGAKCNSLSLVADGGLLSNYPVWLLDDGTSEPAWPTFGFKFAEPPEDTHDCACEQTRGVLSYGMAIIETLLEAHDNREISTQRGDHKRSVVISTTADGHSVKATDFSITREQSLALYENGAASARAFLDTWDFEKWKRIYRHADYAEASAL